MQAGDDELYKPEKITPLMGCLPVVVQIPCSLRCYWVLLASVETRTPRDSMIHDLATPDPCSVLLW